jgi:radical SAM superfamily enzyme YgiQ (UPF0313 family)
MTNESKETILLILLPFWDPEIPPLGISCLKSFLVPHGYQVTTADGNTQKQFRKIYFRYYEVLRKYIPESLRRNLLNDGVTVLRNHLMAHLHQEDKEEYFKLLKILVEKNFFTSLDPHQLTDLEQVIIDFYAAIETYYDHLLEEVNPDVVGFSAFSGSLPASLFACRLAKKRNSKIRTLLGGQVFSDQLMVGTQDFDEFLENSKDYVDCVIVGEGEQLMLSWLQAKLPAAKRVFTLKDIDNQNVDLIAVNPPDYKDLDLSYYAYIGVYGSRSCPYNCGFCSETVFWGNYRKKNIDQLLDEFKRLYEQHSYQMFMLTDSLLNPIVTQLADAIRESGYSFYWDGYLRADPPVRDIENTMRWRRGGYYRTKLGLESGSPRILQKMGKKITIPHVKEALHALAYAGIKTTTAWMVGFPGETEEDFQMTLDLIEELRDYIYEVKLQYFKYYLRGQPDSVAWAENSFPILLYPEWAKNMLVSQSWYLNCDPSWEVVIDRVNRFMDHSRKLGLPSNYTIEDVNAADRRWQKLQINAVPPLVELHDKNIYVQENKQVQKIYAAVNTVEEDSDWL